MPHNAHRVGRSSTSCRMVPAARVGSMYIWWWRRRLLVSLTLLYWPRNGVEEANSKGGGGAHEEENQHFLNRLFPSTQLSFFVIGDGVILSLYIILNVMVHLSWSFVLQWMAMGKKYSIYWSVRGAVLIDSIQSESWNLGPPILVYIFQCI